MNLDELKRGLTTLADEMEPFEGNVRALHRRERRRRVAVSSIAAVVVVAIAVATVAITRNGDSGKIHVAGVPSKEVSPAEITHIDAIVVPASPALKALLDGSPQVSRYTLVARADRTSASLSFSPDKGLCALQSSDGYAVDYTSPIPPPAVGFPQTVAALGATYYDESDSLGADAEIFMQVGIAREYSMAIEGQLASDADVQSFRYLSIDDAYAVFKKDFAAQPALIESTKPSDLPESFRIIVKPGRAVSAVVARYAHRDGVDSIIRPPTQALFNPAGIPTSLQGRTSPCAKP
jgi:hypothetical protein